MLRFYNYIYYRAYRSGLRGFGNVQAAVWGACIELGGLIVVNVLGLLDLLQILTGSKISDRVLNASIWQQVGVALAFGILVNQVWGTAEKAKEIAKEFEKVEETKQQRFWRGVGVTAYEVAWLILFIGCALFMHYYPAYG